MGDVGDAQPFISWLPNLQLMRLNVDTCSIRTRGCHALHTSQGLVGGAAKFEPFLKAYLQNFKFQTLTTDDFKSYFCTYFKDTKAVQDIDWQTWLYAPGQAPHCCSSAGIVSFSITHSCSSVPCRVALLLQCN